MGGLQAEPKTTDRKNKNPATCSSHSTNGSDGAENNLTQLEREERVSGFERDAIYRRRQSAGKRQYREGYAHLY